MWHNYSSMAESSPSQNPEELWSRLLSRQAGLIEAAFVSLTAEQKAAVLTHLTRMTEESGWHAEQRLSAKAALKVLSKIHSG